MTSYTVFTQIDTPQIHIIQKRKYGPLTSRLHDEYHTLGNFLSFETPQIIANILAEQIPQQNLCGDQHPVPIPIRPMQTPWGTSKREIIIPYDHGTVYHLGADCDESIHHQWETANTIGRHVLAILKEKS